MNIELPPEFEQERPRLEKFQREQFETLKVVAAFCDCKGLRYFIASGTALGAARHGGFIPWDDDIDIVMPRCDYERFAALIKTEGADILRSLDWKRDKDFLFQFLKVGRAGNDSLDHAPGTIDVFPLDVVPRSRFLRRLMLVITMGLHAVVYARTEVYTDLRHKLYKLIFFWLPKDNRRVHGLIDRINSSVGKWGEGCTVGFLYSMYKDKEFKPVEYYGINGGAQIEFNGVKFFAPVKLDEYLRSFFGDWRQFPPIDKRLPHHVDDGYWFYSQFSANSTI